MALERWLEDFGYVLTADEMRRHRQDDKYDVFAGSKPLAWAWLSLVATLGGALGGTLASGALWRPFYQVVLWLALTVVFFIVFGRATRSVSGPPLGFLFGWTIFWSLLNGLVAMCGAQRAGPGWAYGIAGGMGFLVGLVQGGYEPEDLERPDSFFLTGLASAPLGACAAAWIHRNLLADPSTLGAAAITGALAGALFLSPAMAVFFARLRSVQGLMRLATLLLHRDETAAEAVRVLDGAIRLAPEDGVLLDRRALAHALSGRTDAAEADWTRHHERTSKSPAPDIARGWVHLRRGRHRDAAAAFQAALALSKRDRSALIGLGLVRLRSGDAAGALQSLDQVSGKQHDALSLTHLAEAQLAAGDPKAAAGTANDAIDELDSIFGRTWLVRAEAKRALGDIDGAAHDFSKAWHIGEEESVRERAMAGLEAIGRVLEEEEEPE